MESGSTETPEATLQHAIELSNAFSSFSITATNYEAADLDIADDDLPPGEWEGEIDAEVIVKGTLKYRIVWVPTLEPGENVGMEMKGAWEAKKTAILAPRGDTKRGSGIKKQWAGVRGRAKVADLGMADDDIPPGEWEGEIVEEVIDKGVWKYRIVWAPTLEPVGNAGPEMKEVWEAKKARGDAKRGCRTKKQGAGVRGQAKVVKTGSNGGRRGQAMTRLCKNYVDCSRIF